MERTVRTQPLVLATATAQPTHTHTLPSPPTLTATPIQALERAPSERALRLCRGKCYLHLGHYVDAIMDADAAMDDMTPEHWQWKKLKDAAPKEMKKFVKVPPTRAAEVRDYSGQQPPIAVRHRSARSRDHPKLALVPRPLLI